jgi:hypothetical protein
MQYILTSSNDASSVLTIDWSTLSTNITPTPTVQPISTTPIPVPLFKQGIFPYNDNSPSWEGQEFDHANAGQFSCGKTMAQCGCATTSVAMLLKYYGINKFPTGDILDPGSL